MRISAAGPVVMAGLLVVSLSSCDRQSRHAPAEMHATAAATPSAAQTDETAQPVRPDPRVGAVFLGAGSLHTCTGAVLASATRDLILTAAHCLAEGVDTAFVGAFDNDAAPDTVWHVDTVYLDPRWVQNQDPLADFAIARVSRDAGGSIQDQAGGGLSLGPAPASGTVVTVAGYGMGVGGGPIGCHMPTAPPRDGFPSLPCQGLADGLSGAPWITGSSVTGLIGGLDGGGCDENVSYSPPFDDAITQLLGRAEAGGPGDDAPTVLADDCA
jgi:Trypsin